MSNTKLNNQQLTVFFAQVLEHLQLCHNELADKSALNFYNGLCAALDFELYASNGCFVTLDDDEKEKVKTALKTIFQSLPIYQNLSEEEKVHFWKDAGLYDLSNGYSRFQLNPNERHSWKHISRLMKQVNSPAAIAQAPSNEGTNWANLFNNLLIACLTLIGPISPFIVISLVLLHINIAIPLLIYIGVYTAANIALSLISGFNLINLWADGLERIMHNEGWLKPTLMIIASIVGAAIAVPLFFYFPGIFLLDIAFGMFEPFAFTSLVVGLVTIPTIAAAFSAFVTGLIYDAVEKNSEALDPADASRFCLTEDEEQNLVEQGIDPTKVLCAMIALRAQMSDYQNDEKTIPGFFSRKLGKAKPIQTLLEEVRHLRRGEIDQVAVGGLVFDCRASSQSPQGQALLFANT